MAKKTNDTRYYHNNRFNVIALFPPQSPKIFFIIADIIICIGFVWLYLVDHFFRKKAKNEKNKA